VKFNESTTVIKIEFPYEFARDLGPNIHCISPDLTRSVSLPINCTYKDWIVNISNTTGYSGSGVVDFTVIISGVINPSMTPLPTTSKIGIFILTEDNVASEYKVAVDNAGAAYTYTSPASVLD
jgi:hypothetical protein